MTRTRINKKDYTYFAACICDNRPNKQVAQEFNVACKTVVTYKSYAKAVVSGNRDLGHKIYKNLNKDIMDKIDEGILMGGGTKLSYKPKNKIRPEQMGPRPRINKSKEGATTNKLEHINKSKEGATTNKLEHLMRPVEAIPELNLSSCAINHTASKSHKSEKEEAPIKEVIGLLQSTLEAVQLLLNKL